jgi:hypothetical protein
MLQVSTRVSRTGPLFDGRAHALMRQFVDELEEEAAEEALADIRTTYETHFRQPTGYYESNVRIHNVSGSPEVWDGGYAGPAYGPWLEGVGSRNATTRFKGYHAFRIASTKTQMKIESMGYRLFDTRYQHRF